MVCTFVIHASCVWVYPIILVGKNVVFASHFEILEGRWSTPPPPPPRKFLLSKSGYTKDGLQYLLSRNLVVRAFWIFMETRIHRQHEQKVLSRLISCCTDLLRSDLFSFVAFVEKLCYGPWNFSTKCNRKSETCQNKHVVFHLLCCCRRIPVSGGHNRNFPFVPFSVPSFGFWDFSSV